MNVSHNGLQWVPPQLFHIPSLEKLNLSNNKLQSLEYTLEDELSDLSNRETAGKYWHINRPDYTLVSVLSG